ncbi:MAG: hypothetical protein M3Y13_04480 [Armatimonadota bacterium]|nr:hypothetical protein [Armatimonadota bacterium]
MSAKICPRCGAQYENLKSTTCPQCFARLLLVDEATAEELSQARAQVERSPEFQEAKAEDDERFRQQSFGACLGVLGITLATVVLVIVLVSVGVRRSHHIRHAIGPKTPVVVTTPAPPLTTLPVAAASLDDVMPAAIDTFKRTERDQDVSLPGTLTRVFHAAYQTPNGQTTDVYALPSGNPTSEQSVFQTGVTLAAQMQKRQTVFFATEHWHYAALGPNGDALRGALFTYLHSLE